MDIDRPQIHFSKGIYSFKFNDSQHVVIRIASNVAELKLHSDFHLSHHLVHHHQDTAGMRVYGRHPFSTTLLHYFTDKITQLISDSAQNRCQIIDIGTRAA